ncbi:MAG: FIST N-terminal domain-containing protein [Acidobacteriota bacterium]
MRSRTIALTSAGLSPSELGEASRAAGRDPDLALAFLPATPDLGPTLDALAAAWPATLRCGCEVAGQISDTRSTGDGSVQVFWFDRPERPKPPEALVLEGSFDHPPAEAEIAAFAGRLAGADGVLLFADGVRFPAERVLAEIGRRLAPSKIRIAGGLGTGVFLDRRIYPAACLALLLHGVDMQVEVLRGWTAASPIYTVTRAEGPVLYEIDGESATDWYRRFFTVRGELAPLPEASQGFPLIIVGPSSRRRGLYRSLRAFDRSTGTVTLWGELETGDQVRMGMFDGGDVESRFESLEAAAGRMRTGGAPVEAAILYSCVDRQDTLGERMGEEIATLHRALGQVPLSGFFTFGEIGPCGDATPAYYNHTAVLALLREGAS